MNWLDLNSATARQMTQPTGRSHVRQRVEAWRRAYAPTLPIHAAEALITELGDVLDWRPDETDRGDAKVVKELDDAISDIESATSDVDCAVSRAMTALAGLKKRARDAA